jgi:hypothetical protein
MFDHLVISSGQSGLDAITKCAFSRRQLPARGKNIAPARSPHVSMDSFRFEDCFEMLHGFVA